MRRFWPRSRQIAAKYRIAAESQDPGPESQTNRAIRIALAAESQNHKSRDSNRESQSQSNRAIWATTLLGFCVEQLISELPLPGAARRELNLITVTGLPRDRINNYALSELFGFYGYRLMPLAN